MKLCLLRLSLWSVLHGIILLSYCSSAAAISHGDPAALAEDEPLPEQLDVDGRGPRPRPKAPLRLNAITSAVGNQTTLLDDARAFFSRGGAELGVLNLNSNYPQFSGTALPTTEPLSVRLSGSEYGVIFGQTIQISGLNYLNQGVELTICLPRTEIDPNAGPRQFYFDFEGTPYFDAARRNQALPERCPSLIARSYRPERVEVATTNSYSDLMFSQARLMRGLSSLGQLDLQTGYYFPASADAPESGHALAIELSAIQEGVIPAQTLFLGTTDEYAGVTLCVPEAEIDHDWNIVNFYFDSQGTAYFDAALRERATDLTCPAILSRGLRLKGLIEASSNVLSTLEGARARFTSGVDTLAELNLEDNSFEFIDLVSGAELHALKVTFTANQDGILPRRKINLTGLTTSYQYFDREYCFPRMQVEGELVYYLDRFGGVYSDALLSSPVECPRPRRSHYDLMEAY